MKPPMLKRHLRKKAAGIEKEKASKVDEIADVKAQAAGAAFEKEKSKVDEIADVMMIDSTLDLW